MAIQSPFCSCFLWSIMKTVSLSVFIIHYHQKSGWNFQPFCKMIHVVSTINFAVIWRRDEKLKKKKEKHLHVSTVWFSWKLLRKLQQTWKRLCIFSVVIWMMYYLSKVRSDFEVTFVFRHSSTQQKKFIEKYKRGSSISIMRCVLRIHFWNCGNRVAGRDCLPIE